tara:strand:- start:77 stop:289 length:213 start_codon:yes stop_codon:yes gene_type:complete
MKTKHKVSSLQSKLHQIEKELASIQEKCKHSTTITKFDKTNSIRVFCVECDKQVGMASDQQIQEFLNTRK